MKKRDKINLGIFVFVTITAGLWGYLLDHVLTEQPEGDSLGMGVWLVLPFTTGIVLRIIQKDFHELGVRPNFKHNLKWYAFAVLFFPGIMLVSMILAKMTGGLIICEKEQSGLFVWMFTTFFVNCIKNIFEEFAWRGCLVPYLEKTGRNDAFLYVVSGLIWGMWHIVYYMFFMPDAYFIEHSRTEMVMIGIVLMILWSPLFVELRRITKSVWPCVILHSMEDAVPTLLFVTAGVFQMKEKYSVMLDPISGIVPAFLVLLAGFELRKCRMRRDANCFLDNP